jgi:hypothetical protein
MMFPALSDCHISHLPGPKPRVEKPSSLYHHLDYLTPRLSIDAVTNSPLPLSPSKERCHRLQLAKDQPLQELPTTVLPPSFTSLGLTFGAAVTLDMVRDLSNIIRRKADQRLRRCFSKLHYPSSI